MEDLVEGTHGVPLDVAELLKGRKQVLVAATEVDWPRVASWSIAVVRHCQLATVNYQLFGIRLGLVDQDLEHADTMRLIARH